VARELTKQFEEVRRGTLAELAAYYDVTPPRGEVVIVVGGGEATALSEDDLRAQAATFVIGQYSIELAQPLDDQSPLAAQIAARREQLNGPASSHAKLVLVHYDVAAGDERERDLDFDLLAGGQPRLELREVSPLRRTLHPTSIRSHVRCLARARSLVAWLPV